VQQEQKTDPIDQETHQKAHQDAPIVLDQVQKADLSGSARVLPGKGQTLLVQQKQFEPKGGILFFLAVRIARSHVEYNSVKIENTRE